MAAINKQKRSALAQLKALQEQKERLRSSECHDQLFKLKLEESRERRRKRREEKLQITAEEQFEAERRAEEEERKGMLEYFAQWQEENRKKAEEEEGQGGTGRPLSSTSVEQGYKSKVYWAW